MLQQLRDQTQSTGFKILVVAIILVLTLFGFGATNMFSGTMPNIASVGGYEITESVLAVETERERRRLITQMGPEFDPNDIDRLQLQNYALSQLINRQILYQAADQLGIQFASAEVDQRLLESPAYQVAGEFNEALYRQQLQLMGFAPLQFIQEVRQGLASELLRDAVANSAFAQDWEVAQAVALLNQRRDIAYLSLNVADYLSEIEVSEDDIDIRYNEDRSTYVTSPSIDVEWVEISLAGMEDRVDVDTTDATLLAIYEDDLAMMDGDAQRDSAHILVVVDEGTDEGAALERIESAASRLAAGEDFAALALELSDDPGSADRGGNLGLMNKGSFDEVFEEALWALVKPGDISAPVRSEFGYHLIRLNEIEAVEVPAFEDEKDRIVARLVQEAAAEAFDTILEEMEQQAFEERYGLTQTAAALGVAIQQVQGVKQEDSSEGRWSLAGNIDVMDSLFSNEGLEGENSPVLTLGGDRAAVVRVTQYYPSEQLALADVRQTVVDELKLERALSKIEAEKSEALVQLTAGTSVSDVANELGKRWTTQELIGRGGATSNGATEVPQEVLAEAFAMARPESGNKTIGSITTPQGSTLIVVTRVLAGDVDATAQAAVSQIEQQVAARDQQLQFAAFFAAAEESVGVNRPE